MAHSSHGAHHHLSHLPVEPVAAIVLAAAGVLTSWAGYQASLWDGMQLAHYGRSASYRVEASQAALDASLQRSVEVNLFSAWAEARFNGESRMALYYQDRFPPELVDEHLERATITDMRESAVEHVESNFIWIRYRRFTAHESERCILIDPALDQPGRRHAIDFHSGARDPRRPFVRHGSLERRR